MTNPEFPYRAVVVCSVSVPIRMSLKPGAWSVVHSIAAGQTVVVTGQHDNAPHSRDPQLLQVRCYRKIGDGPEEALDTTLPEPFVKYRITAEELDAIRAGRGAVPHKVSQWWMEQLGRIQPEDSR